jgi:hypothetical protein
MDWRALSVEVIKGIFSAPFIFGAMIFYFLRKYGLLIGEILKRLSKVSFPGVEVNMTPYPVMSDAPNIQATLPATSDISKDLRF